MGRLSHLTRLALGRSAYGDPVRDQDGNDVINSSIYAYDPAEYQQQFDRRGHPANEETTRSDRRLRRAQNEVLQIVGVTRTKHSQRQRLARRHSLSTAELVDTVEYENVFGSLLNAVIPFPMDTCSWWIRSFRARLCTFRPHYQPDLLHMLRSERPLLGNRTFFLGGLGYSLAADEIREYRHWRQPPLQHWSTFESYSHTWTEKLLSVITDFGLFAIEWPIRARGTLQALSLLQPLPDLPWYQLVPLLSASPLLYVRGTSEMSLSNPLSLLSAVIASPLVAAYLLEQVRISLESGIYILLRLSIPRPMDPDQISLEGAVEEAETYAGYSPGFGFPLLRDWVQGAQMSFWSRLKAVFPSIARMSQWVSSTQKKARIEPHDRNDILQAARARYSQLVRANQMLLRPNMRLTDVELRRQAISDAFAEALIDPRGSRVNIHQWADDISLHDDGASTATPDAEDILPALRQTELRLDDAPAAPDEALGADEAFAPAVPLGTLLEPAEIPDITRPTPEPGSNGQPWPPTPELGLSRAASLTQASNHPSVAPRPIRRPTELDEDISHTASALRSPVQPANGGAPDTKAVDDEDLSVHRVTTLSAFPAETLARYGSSLITSMLLLPFDVYYTRHLAKTYLRSPPQADIGLSLASRDVASTWPTMDVFSIGTLVLARNVLVTFGIEAVLKGVVWAVSTKLCVWTGRKFFLWGVA